MSATQDTSRAQAFWKLVATSSLPDIGPAARSEALPADQITAKLSPFFQEQSVAENLRDPLRAAALLWHDHLGPSHEVAQELGSQEGSFIHGIMHRREPDYGNAKYWFHRVGRHACFTEIVRLATPELVRLGQSAWTTRLMPNGIWDPFAFIDAVQQAMAEPPDHADREILRAVQKFEFEALVGHLLKP